MIAGRDRSAAGSNRIWRVGSREIVLDRPMVVGILNVTPDSFSDGGNFFAPEAAIMQAERMIADGVDIIDVGGESTRPGAVSIEAADEAIRVIPVLRELRERWPSVLLSIDTMKSGVAEAALESGADIVNDVSALRLDPSMPALAARWKCGLILMHSRGGIESMATYEHAVYGDIASEVMAELGSQLLFAEEAGVDRRSIVLDPGFGFAKRSQHSLRLLRELERFSAFDVPVMVGVSRKRFVGEAMFGDGAATAPDRTIQDRDAGTGALNVMALERGAGLFRVHDVRTSRRSLDAAWAVLNAQQ